MSSAGTLAPEPARGPKTLAPVDRGEHFDGEELAGHSLIWLWPHEGPAAADDPRVLRREGRAVALEICPGQSLTMQRGVNDIPTLDPGTEGWELSLPSDETYADVSRAPTRIFLSLDGNLSVQTEARGRQRFWIDLTPMDGPNRPAPVPHWAAIGVGPVVLWYVPFTLAAARMHCSAAEQGGESGGFRIFSQATQNVINNLRRRVSMRFLVPRAATSERWEASQPFILAGEPGCGKTTLARAAFSTFSTQPGEKGFAAVHPVAVEQEIDLVALTGSANFAHDGVRVPDQEGLLDVATHEQGVVLVDEVHTLGPRLKKHLIDLLTEWTFRPRGDTTRRKKIRGLIVFATNQLDMLRDPQRFPADLYARMGGEAAIIEVPPLRQRRWEVPLLAELVLAELQPTVRLSENAMRKLLLHSWPQNHWELESAVSEAHGLALTHDQAIIQPECLKLRPPKPEDDAPPAASDVLGAQPSAWRFPQKMGWPELFLAVHHYSSFTSLRDAWQQQLGAKNAAAINRRIGRFMRCDRCEPTSCPRCFIGLLASAEAGDVARRLIQIGKEGGVPPEDVSSWSIRALSELVVERIESFKNTVTRATADAAIAHPGIESLLELIEALKRQIGSPEADTRELS